MIVSLATTALASTYAPLQALPFVVQGILAFLVVAGGWMLFNLLRLRGVPGPLWAKSGIPGVQAYYAIKLEWVWRLQDLHDKYGPIVRIGPNQVDFSSAAALRKIYAHGSPYHKPKSFYDGFVVAKGHPSIFSDTDPHSHAQRRRQVSSAYALNYLVKLEDCVDPLIDSLISKLAQQMIDSPKKSLDGSEEKGLKGTFDVTKIFHFFAMDAVGELAFGRSFNFLETMSVLETMSDPKKFLRGVSNLSQWGGALAFLPPCLGDVGRKAFKFLLKEPGSEVIGTSTRDRVASRYTLLREGQEPLRPDMLAKFVEAKKSDGSRLSQDEVLYTATSIIAAGSDTTSLALASTIRYLLANPQAYEKLQQEVDEAFEHGRLSEPCSYAAAVKLPFLQACVKEALRLHPPISMSLPRVVPPEGDVIDGRFYPGGTIVSISPYVIHRDINIWGQDAKEYRPERWLEAEKSEEQRKDLERNFFSFGGGSRQCIGKNISIMEVTKCLPRLLWHFHFQATPRGRIDSPHTLRGRGDDGKWNEGEPWHVTSSWFLNAEQLWVDIRARRSDELELLVD